MKSIIKNPSDINRIEFCGFEYAKGDYIITLDDDLQVPPEEITKLIDKFKETDADLVYGYFGKKHHSVVRNVGSYFIKKSSRPRHR